MNAFSNIWNHPKTSAAGLLIAVITIAGVLSQQGITLGKAGTGSGVTLVCALATALLGLLARDPGEASPSNNSTAHLGAWALIALLLQVPFVSGCSGVSVAQDIVNWTPALESAVAAVDTSAAVLAPADAPVFVAATANFDAASSLLVSQANAYLADPSATALSQLQAQIVVLQQDVNSAILQTAKIVNPASQQKALADIQAVGTVVSAILALVQSVSSPAAVARMASQSTIKLTAVRSYRSDLRATQLVATHYGESVQTARLQIAQIQSAEIQAGF